MLLILFWLPLDSKGHIPQDRQQWNLNPDLLDASKFRGLDGLASYHYTKSNGNKETLCYSLLWMPRYLVLNGDNADYSIWRLPTYIHVIIYTNHWAPRFCDVYIPHRKEKHIVDKYGKSKQREIWPAQLVLDGEAHESQFSTRKHPVYPAGQAVIGNIIFTSDAKIYSTVLFNENRVGKNESPLFNNGSRLRNQELSHMPSKNR